jgi:hypothetical protein
MPLLDLPTDEWISCCRMGNHRAIQFPTAKGLSDLLSLLAWVDPSILWKTE